MSLDILVLFQSISKHSLSKSFVSILKSLNNDMGNDQRIFSLISFGGIYNGSGSLGIHSTNGL